MTINNLSLGDLSLFSTDDGSLSLHSSSFNENFHSSCGAFKEANEKFIQPAKLNRIKNRDIINVLDVCIGMGYNSACLFEALKGKKTKLEWWGLEIDNKPIKLSVNNAIFKSIWSKDVMDILKSINKESSWSNNQGIGRVLWGDAREMLSFIPNNVLFDLIFLDAFSPSKCPILWTDEFLLGLAKKLSPGGRLITYCSAAAIRASLRRSGLELASIIPIRNKRKWSHGTIAITPHKSSLNFKEENNLRSLTQMEEEHLLTRAAVPYRDPSGHSTIKEVLERRHKEQKTSKLEKTNDWKRRWIKTH